MKRTMLVCGALVAAALTIEAKAQVSIPDPRHVPELQAEFARAEKAGLPVDDLVAVARKGYLLNYSAKEIRTAVRGAANRFDRARNALQPARGPGELRAGADAILAGVPERVLKNLRAAAPTRSIEVPLGVLTELVSKGASVTMAAERVELMLRRQAVDAYILALGSDVLGDVAAGLAPTVALDIRSQSVLSLLPAAGPAAAVAPNRIPR
jgi:hypothetical protein